MEPNILSRLIDLGPDLLIRTGHAILAVAVLGGVYILVVKLINKAANYLTAREAISANIVLVAGSILRWMAFIAILFLALQQMGVNISSLWAVISALTAMVAVGFVAVWSVLSNLLCTIMLVVLQPFRIGDEIEVIDPSGTSGVRGRVRNINLMFTTLHETGGEDRDGSEIHIPNNQFFQKFIRHWTGARTFRLDKQLFEQNSLLKNGEAEPEKGEEA